MRKVILGVVLSVTASTVLAQFGAGLGGGGISIEMLDSFAKSVEVKPLVVEKVDLTPQQAPPATVTGNCSSRTAKGGSTAKTKTRCKKK